MTAIKGLGIFCTTLLTASRLYADAGWTGYGEVQELAPNSRHYYQVRLSIEKDPSGCKNPSWFYQDYAAPGSELMFQTLLDALKAELSVKVYVTGRCNLDGSAEISEINVKR